jgi:hypothetical protein
MSKTKFDNNYLPKRMNIILYTKTDQYSRKFYEPQMSIPSSSSRFVNFNPLIKINKDTFFNTYKIKPNDPKPLSDNIIDIFLNKQKFDDLLNDIVMKTDKKELSIQDSCTQKVIDNNIKTTLDVLFKSGNVLEIDKKSYTIYNYTWLNGDWLIYSRDIKKETDEYQQSTRRFNNIHRQYNEETEQQITTNAFNKLSQEIPNCLKGNPEGTSLFITGEKKNTEEQNASDENANYNKVTDDNNISKFFDESKLDTFSLSENNNYLPYNLTYDKPSFLKDPISVSLFYLGYNYGKETKNYSSLSKAYKNLEDKRGELESNIKNIFNYTSSFLNSDDIDTRKQNQTTTQNELTTKLEELVKNRPRINELYNKYNSKKLVARTCEITIKTELESIIRFLSAKKYNISDNLDKLNNSLNCNDAPVIQPNDRHDINKLFNNIINSVDQSIKEIQNQIKEHPDIIVDLKILENSLSKDTSIKKYISFKKDYLSCCRESLILIQKKIELENEYLLALITFYKQLYTYKKSELSSTYQLSSDQKWLLTIINQIILFDLLIYNTIYTSGTYRTKINETKKLINEYIEKITNFQKIKFNEKDEKINKKDDIPVLSSFLYIVYYSNYVIDMEFWKMFSSETLEKKNTFSTIVSKTLQNYHNLNESFSHAPEYETKLKNMKYTCFDLINIYSRINMICFLRNYICDEYNLDFDRIIKKVGTTLNARNKFFLNISNITNHTYESKLKNAYLNYINSVKLLTPTITSGSIENICNKLIDQEVEYDNIPFTSVLRRLGFPFIKANFNDDRFTEFFMPNPSTVSLLAYNNTSVAMAIENGLNWYLCLYNPKMKYFEDEYPIELDDNELEIWENKYKINICIIENNNKKALIAIKESAKFVGTRSIKIVADLIKQKIITDNTILRNIRTEKDSISREISLKNINDKEFKESDINVIYAIFSRIYNSITRIIDIYRIPNLSPETNSLIIELTEIRRQIFRITGQIDMYMHNFHIYFSKYNQTFNKTIYIFKNNDDYYTVFDNDNCIFDKTDPFDRTFHNIINPIEQPTTQRGGTTQKEQIESITNQSLFSDLLQNPQSDNDKKKIIKNTLAYIVPIKLEIYEGKDVPTDKKVSLKCEENYNNILKAWKVLFNIKGDKSDLTIPPSRNTI